MTVANRLEALVEFLERGPRESIDFELKDWLDPRQPHGKAKIVKGCLAMRNSNGGTLVFGFDKNGNQTKPPLEIDFRAAFCSDFIQEQIGHFASEPFSVDVDFLTIRGQEHPVLRVPSGIVTPVVCNGDLNTETAGRLLRDHAVYVRSLTSNNRVSSSEVRKGDWKRLIETCFENREADIANFVRRHLSDLLDHKRVEDFAELGPGATTKALMDTGRNRFLEEANNRDIKISEKVGFREFAVVVEGDAGDVIPDNELLARIDSGIPRLWGLNPWQIFLAPYADDSPNVVDGQFEALIQSSGLGSHKEGVLFWTLDPHGNFYHLRELEDDTNRGRNGRSQIPPGVFLDFYLQIIAVAEGIVVALSIARSLGFDDSLTSVWFAARWTNLKDRRLESWADPSRSLRSSKASKSESFFHKVKIPLNTPNSNIHEYVSPIIQRLFACFGGTTIGKEVVRSITNNFLDRK